MARRKTQHEKQEEAAGFRRTQTVDPRHLLYTTKDHGKIDPTWVSSLSPAARRSLGIPMFNYSIMGQKV